MYKLQDITENRAKKILRNLLIELSHIDVDDMTTFELNLLHRVAINPPKKTRGREEDLMKM